MIFCLFSSFTSELLEDSYFTHFKITCWSLELCCVHSWGSVNGILQNNYGGGRALALGNVNENEVILTLLLLISPLRINNYILIKKKKFQAAIRLCSG